MTIEPIVHDSEIVEAGCTVCGWLVIREENMSIVAAQEVAALHNSLEGHNTWACKTTSSSHRYPGVTDPAWDGRRHT